MQIRCPACKKLNDSTDECNRCGGNLSDLRRIRRAAVEELKLGKRYLLRMNSGKALLSASSSWRLKKSVSAAKLAFLASLMGGHFSEATRWYRMATTGGSLGSARDRQPGIMDSRPK